MLRLYNTVLLPIRVGVALWDACRPQRDGSHDEWAERRARRLPSLPPHGLWIHGASVGEARIIRDLARSVRARRPGLAVGVSSYTRTGRAQLPAPPLADAAFFLPLDFPGLATRLLEALRPAALVLVETELWPNLLHESHARGVPVVVLNGRLSASRMTRYRRFFGLFAPLLRRITAVGAQTEADAQRFRELGVPPEAVTTTGNVKYDLSQPAGEEESLRLRLGLPLARPVFVAGSTGPGEEVLVLDAFVEARRKERSLFLILAPRHLSRIDEVWALLRSRGLTTIRHSAGVAAGEETDVLLVDTLGELPALYRLGRTAFVGGSLVPIGGHNLLEPVAVGVPVLFGPYTESVEELALLLEQSGAGSRVEGPSALARELGRLLVDDAARAEMSRRAGAILEANRGSLERSVSLLLSVVDGSP